MVTKETAQQRVLRLRTERLRRGWSQTKVSVLTGIPGPTISALERGLIPAWPGWRRRLSRAFGMPQAELFEPADEHDQDAGAAR